MTCARFNARLISLVINECWFEFSCGGDGFVNVIAVMMIISPEDRVESLTSNPSLADIY